jgi:hypothetical protein
VLGIESLQPDHVLSCAQALLPRVGQAEEELGLPPTKMVHGCAVDEAFERVLADCVQQEVPRVWWAVAADEEAVVEQRG